MDIVVLTIIMSIVTVLVLVCVGLSYISAGLDGLAYNKDSKKEIKYYRNPLLAYGSKYFHYKPADAVVVTRRKWTEIETNMAYELREAEDRGRATGYKQALEDVESKAKAKAASYSSSDPYEVLGVNSSITKDGLEIRYTELMEKYTPTNFTKYGDEFVRLARVKADRIRKAYRSILMADLGNTGA